MAKNNETQVSPEFNRIVTGTTIQGEIKTNSDIRIDGIVIGSINSKGKVVIGPTGQVEGEIICQNADISGTIKPPESNKAKITVQELLHLKATAKISGEIYTNKLAIDPGAKFSGTCNMDEEIKHIKDVLQSKGTKEIVGEKFS